MRIINIQDYASFKLKEFNVAMTQADQKVKGFILSFFTERKLMVDKKRERREQDDAKKKMEEKKSKETCNFTKINVDLTKSVDFGTPNQSPRLAPNFKKLNVHPQLRSLSIQDNKFIQKLRLKCNLTE